MRRHAPAAGIAIHSSPRYPRALCALDYRPERRVGFAYSPENLRLGKAIETFERPERIIIGTDESHSRATLTPLLGRFSDQLIWVSHNRLP